MSETNTVSPLRQRMIEDLAAPSSTRTRSAATSIAASGSPRGSNARPTRRRPTRCAVFQLYHIESGASIWRKSGSRSGSALQPDRF
jgi:hypothetical protein